MSSFYFYLMLIRNFYKNLTKRIILLEKNKKIYDKKYIIDILKYIPLSFYILKLFKFNVLFEIDNIIFYDDTNLLMSKETNLFKTNLLLLNFILMENNDKVVDINYKIQKYNYNVPLYIIFYNEKINWNKEIEINCFLSGKNIKKIHNINDVFYNKIIEII